MPAVGKVHPENLIAVLNRGEIHRHVRLCAAVRLHIRVIGAKQFFRAIDRGLLDNVGPFTAAIVALTRIAFGVFVSKDRARSFKYGFTDKVFRSDKFKPVRLPRDFVIDRIGDQWIGFGERSIKIRCH